MKLIYVELNINPDLSTFGNAFYGLVREKCPIGGGFQVHTAYGKTRFIVQENK